MSVLGGNKDQVMNLKEEEKNIPDGLGITKFAEGLDWFGFGKPTGVRLVGEQPGRVPTPAWKQKVLLQAWTTGDLYNAAIGQGNLEVTPLQLVTGAVAVANNGNLYRPQIVKAITDASGKLVQEIQPELVNRVPVDPANFAVVRDGMRRSVTEGPNVAARDACSGLQIAGKTGTAEFGPNIEIPPLDGKPRAVGSPKPLLVHRLRALRQPADRGAGAGRRLGRHERWLGHDHGAGSHADHAGVLQYHAAQPAAQGLPDGSARAAAADRPERPAEGLCAIRAGPVTSDE